MTSLVDPIGFIGAGAMGEALIGSLLRAGTVGATQILAADSDPDRRTYLAKQYGIKVTASNPEVVGASPLVVLAVKPQVAAAVLSEVGESFQAGQVLMSIVAGWGLRRLEGYLGRGVAVVRSMPNTPCLVGKGITALSYGREADASVREKARIVFSAAGEVTEISEQYLDAVTAVSGCGPAYVFLVIEALADAGVRIGLPRPVALKLAVETLRGAATMAAEPGEHPARLKDKVTSPGGATIEGLAVMEEAGLRGIFIKAVEAAWRRAGELGKEES